jgi:hypothetical protein
MDSGAWYAGQAFCVSKAKTEARGMMCLKIGNGHETKQLWVVVATGGTRRYDAYQWYVTNVVKGKGNRQATFVTSFSSYGPEKGE